MSVKKIETNQEQNYYITIPCHTVHTKKEKKKNLVCYQLSITIKEDRKTPEFHCLRHL